MTGEASLDDASLEQRLVRYRPDLVLFVRKHAGRLGRFETTDDLTQGIHLRALDRGSDLEQRGERAFLSWMYTVARSYLADRHQYWSALKRGSGNLLRISASAGATTDPRAVGEPPLDATGPSTFASRREQVVLAIKALDLLFERDRKLVRWHAEGVPLREQGTRLGIAHEAVRRAHSRALERYRKAFRMLAR